MVGSVVVAILATLAVLVFDGEAELDAARWVMAAFIAVIGYFVARSSGASFARSVTYASATMVVAVGIVLVKNTLSGH